ncbi:MAG: hypothetical protein M0P94_02540 [Candidatus Absconditabacterales bacterium]|nr:hypothetical protein [Candidatus Absconditabacterales bacterium]
MKILDIGNKINKKNQKTPAQFNTETMIPISEIKNDVVILKDGGLRSILKVEGINLDLKNAEDQQIILEQYKKFLNGLGFPIQIIVRNNYLDLSSYLSYINKNLTNIINPTLKQTGESYYRFLENIDNQQGLIYEKSFYIVVPYYIGEKDETSIKKSWFTKFLDVLNSKDNTEKIVERYRGFQKGKNMLDSRCNLLTDGLASIGIRTEKLGTSEIISLLFNYYNPLLHNAQGVL